MFIGHFGVGLGAKAAAPSVSLGTFFLAAQFIDLLWPTLLQLGIEQARIAPGASPGPPLDFTYYPFSHSLLMVIAWAVVFAAVHYGLRHRLRDAVVLAAVVVSHWLLDLIVHYPDLPLSPANTHVVGLGLWSRPVASMALELAIFAAGVWLYARATEAVDAAGRWALWALVAFLVLIHFANTFGPPPPSITAVALAAQAQWLLVAWGYWVDRHRRPRAIRLLRPESGRRISARRH